MPPFFPEHPLTAITAGERTATTELQTRGAPETEHSIDRPIHQFPAETIRVEVLNRCTGTVGDNLTSLAPGNSLHFFKAFMVFNGMDKFNSGLFSFAADDEVDILAFAQDTLVSIRWIDSTVNDFDVCINFFDFVNRLEYNFVCGG